MHKKHAIFEKIIFKNSPLSNREAFLWLTANSKNGQLHISLRSLGTIWKWHYSAVKRFLDKLKEESLIEISIFSKSMMIKITNQHLAKTISETISEQKQNNESFSSSAFEAPDNTNLQQFEQQYLKQSITDNIDENSFCNNTNHYHICLDEYARTIFAQEIDLNTEQEKKKRSKKRKEFLKERNIPYGDTKKENGYDFSKNSSGFSEQDFTTHQPLITQATSDAICDKSNTPVPLDSARSSAVGGSNQNRLIPFELVQVSDVEIWVSDTLQDSINMINLPTELDKFKNFWRSTHKKPPKDGVSAFKNWLHRAVEFKQQNQHNQQNQQYQQFKFKENNYDGHSSYKSNRQIGFERFLAAGAKVIARYEGC